MPRMLDEGHTGDEPLLTAERVLAWRAARSKRPRAELPEAALLSHQTLLLTQRRPWQRRRGIEGFSFDAEPLGDQLTLAIVRGVGAPATAVAIEELAASGVRKLVAIDVGGSIDQGVRSGSLVLLNGAIAGDGTSPHYTPDHIVEADEELTRHLGEHLGKDGVAFTSGRAWSTDAVYRERPSQLEAARREGALIADMESACVLAVASALGMAAAVVLVAADELHDEWQSPADMALIQASLGSALAIAPTCLLS
jgi:uridine phosphorylase